MNRNIPNISIQPAYLTDWGSPYCGDSIAVFVDIFAGSNTTAYVAETHKRYWYSFDEEIKYVAASAFRFLEKGTNIDELNEIYSSIKSGKTIELNEYRKQLTMFREKAASYKA